MRKNISYDQIDLVTPYPLVLLEEMELITELGEHTALTIRGVLDTGSWRGVDYFLSSTRQADEIELYLKGEERQLRFVGFPASLEIEVHNDVYTLNLICYSATHRMDQEKRKATYQDPKMRCETLLQRITTHYCADHREGDFSPQGGYLGPDEAHQTIGRMYLQYEETDWEFLKRVAADRGTVITADATSGNVTYFFGLPDGKSGLELEAKTMEYRAGIEYRPPTTGRGKVHPRDDVANAVYEAGSGQLFRLGDRVTYQGNELVVVGSVHRMEQGALCHYYQLTHRSAIKPLPYRNERIGGIALEGTVIDVSLDCVKVHFDIDAATVRRPSGGGVFTPDVQTARWIPYAGESNQVWYSMPHKQERIFVYFPSSDEEEAITMSSIRGTGGRMSDAPSMSKPTEKCMETKWGKTMGLHEDHINFQTPLIQALFREDGIEIVSNDTIEITSETELQIGKSELDAAEGGAEETADICIEAEEKLSLVVTSTRTGLELEENTDLYDIFQISLEGTNKAAYPTISSEGMNAGAAAEQALAEALAEQEVEEADPAEETEETVKREPLWKRVGKGVLKAAAGVAIGVCVVAAAPAIAAASTAVALAGCMVAAGSFLVGMSLFCEGANEIQLGARGYSEEEVPATDGMLGLTGHRMELMEGCVTAAMLVLTGAELLSAAPGLLSYGTYLLNEQISKLPPIWPSVTDGITGMSGGAATLGRVLDFVNVPSIPYVFGAAVPVFALANHAQVVSIVGDGIARMAGNGGGSGGAEGARESTYSRHVPESWEKTYETKSLKATANENGWELGKQTTNASNERKVPIYDSSGKKIGEAHLGHKMNVNGKNVVSQDHYHLYSDTTNVHHVLPDK